MSVLLSDPDNRPHIHGYESLLAGFARIREFVRAHGLRMSAGCRLELYSQALDLLGRPIDENDRRVLDISTIVGELHQLITVVDVLGNAPEMPTLFQHVFGGRASDFVLHRPDHDPARDIQFELYLAAALKRIGATVRLAEPDIVVEFEGHRIPFAAKRAKSIKSARGLIRKGREQLRRTGAAGVVAIDLSQCPIDGVLLTAFAPSQAHVAWAAKDVMVRLMKREHARFMRFLGGERYAGTVLGCLLFISIPVQVERPWIGTSGRAWGMYVSARDFNRTAASLLAHLHSAEDRALSILDQGMRGPPTWL